MKIRPVGVELFHADGQMDRHDEANSRFLQYCERVKNCWRRDEVEIVPVHAMMACGEVDGGE
jgi:hypothetical protein